MLKTSVTCKKPRN